MKNNVVIRSGSYYYMVNFTSYVFRGKTLRSFNDAAIGLRIVVRSQAQ